MKEFIKSTKWISRIIFVFCVIGMTGSIADGDWGTAGIGGIFFGGIIAAIEYRTNPALEKLKISRKGRYGGKLQITGIILLLLAPCYILTSVELWGCTVLLIIIAVILLVHVSVIRRKKENSQWKSDEIHSEEGSQLSDLLEESKEGENQKQSGIGQVEVYIQQKADAEIKEERAREKEQAKIEREKQKAEQRAKKQMRREERKWNWEYRGIHLSKEQIQRLEEKIELPCVDTPVFLNCGEVAVYYCDATRQEVRKRAKETITSNYRGQMVLTNKRIVFLSSEKGFDIRYTAIAAANYDMDGISFQSRNHTYRLLMRKVELAVIVFDEVRLGVLPIANTYNSDIIGEATLVDNNTSDTINNTEISEIDGMEGHQFEHFCAKLLLQNDFDKATVTPGSGDQGVDIIAEKEGVKYAIQCKNYSSPLGNTPVQEVFAGKVYYGCHVGVVMTNTTFTAGARDLAKETGILLWDRSMVEKMICKSEKQ